MLELYLAHTSENLVDELRIILAKYGLNLDDLYTLTADNASNMKKLGRLLADEQFCERMLDWDVEEVEPDDNSETQIIEQNSSEQSVPTTDIAIALQANDALDNEGQILCRRLIEGIDDECVKIVAIGCGAHTLQLAVEDALHATSLTRVINKARKAAKELRADKAIARIGGHDRSRIQKPVLDTPPY